MGDEWMNVAEKEAGDVDVPAKPQWHQGVPLCREECPHHNGKRCQLLGNRPDAICEPVVLQMAELLSAMPSSEEPTPAAGGKDGG